MMAGVYIEVRQKPTKSIKDVRAGRESAENISITLCGSKSHLTRGVRYPGSPGVGCDLPPHTTADGDIVPEPQYNPFAPFSDCTSN